MADVRSTQEIFGDLFGGLASLGARGVDGLIISRALANLLVEKGIITIDELVETMRRVIHEKWHARITQLFCWRRIRKLSGGWRKIRIARKKSIPKRIVTEGEGTGIQYPICF